MAEEPATRIVKKRRRIQQKRRRIIALQKQGC
jgi:hypothetical protein